MNTTRSFLGEDHMRLKAAYRTLLKEAGGPADAARDITRTDPARLSRYGNPNEQMFAPLDVIRDLEAHVGVPFVTRVLADLSGFVLAEKKGANTSVDLDHHIVSVAREMSDVVGEIVEAKKDGELTAAERQRILAQVQEGQEALANLEADVQRTGDVVRLARKQG